MPFRVRKRATSTVFLDSRLEKAGTFTDSYPPTGYYRTVDQMVPTNDGYAEVCKDFVHPEFVRGAKRKLRLINNSPDLYIRAKDLGGDLTLYRVDSWSSRKGFGVYRCSYAGETFEYIGGFYPVWPAELYAAGYVWNPNAIRTPDKPGTLFSGDGWTGKSQGPRLWNKTKPKLAVADLGQAVAEMRELLPMVKTSAKMFADEFYQQIARSGTKRNLNTAGDQWLNTQFGWRPFLKDFNDLVEGTIATDYKLNKLYKGNDKWRRRRSKVDSQTLYSNGDMLNNGGRMQYAPSSVSVPHALGTGKSYISGDITQDTWLVGSWKYFIPEFESPSSGIETIANYMRYYGLNISPLLIWNLTPWSWLADWFGNIGDNIANYSAALTENLVGRYAYVMRTTTASFINNSQVAVTDGTATGMRIKNLAWEMKYTLKTRRHASPYGFTTDWPNFSAFQLSILGALGVTRLR